MLRFDWTVFGWSLVALGIVLSVVFLAPGQWRESVQTDDQMQLKAPRWFHPRGTVETSKLLSLGGHFHGMALLWPGPTLVTANHLGIFLSGDRGLSWQLLNPDLAVHGMGRVVATADGRVLVVVGEGAGFKRSEDGGATWRSLRPAFSPERVTALAMDPTDGGRLLLWVDRSLARSEDGGRTWSQVTSEKVPPVLSLASDPRRAERVYAGTERGVRVSDDGGQTWSSPGAGSPIAPVWSLVVPPARPDLLVVGTEEGAFVGNLDLLWWRALASPLDEFGPIVAFTFGADDHDKVFAMTHQGRVFRHSLTELLAFSGTRWTALNLTPEENLAVDVPEGETWFTP